MQFAFVLEKNSKGQNGSSNPMPLPNGVWTRKCQVVLLEAPDQELHPRGGGEGACQVPQPPGAQTSSTLSMSGLCPCRGEGGSKALGCCYHRNGKDAEKTLVRSCRSPCVCKASSLWGCELLEASSCSCCLLAESGPTLSRHHEL